MALAETQWKYGCLTDLAKSHALSVIDNEQDLQRWTAADLKKRRATLLDLRHRLLSEQPKARVPRPRRVVEVPSIKVLSPDERALATAYPLAASTHTEAPRTQVLVEMLASGSRGGGGVFLSTCEYTDVQLTWLDPETLKISYPGAAAVTNKAESAFYYGRTIALVYEARDA